MQRSGKKWLEAYLKSSLRIIVALMPMKGFWWLPGLSVFPDPGASNSNMISRIPVRIRTKKAVTKTGSQESQRIQLTQNRVTRTRIRFAQRITLSRKTVRDRNVGERTRSLKDGFSTHESLSPPSLMLGLHLSLFIMELIKPFCSI